MKTQYKILQKKYHKSLSGLKIHKKSMRKMSRTLEEFGITIDGKRDIDYFQMEIVFQSLKIKHQFEDIFFEVYTRMCDYWEDLTYLERKKQMNIEIQQLKNNLPCFTFHDEKIYMPCFDERFNHLYNTEIVLLHLKQYHLFITKFANLVQRNLYGKLPYQHNFSSAVCVADREQDFILFHTDMNRFYVFKENRYHCMFPFHIKKTIPDEVVKEMGIAILKNDEKHILKLIEESHCVSKGILKKLQKLQHKKDLKAQKEKTRKEV